MKCKKFFGNVVTVPVKDNRRCGNRTHVGNPTRVAAKTKLSQQWAWRK